MNERVVRGLRMWVALALLVASGAFALASAVPAGATTGALTPIAQVSTGGVTSCARLSNGTARCWGSDALGALGSQQTKTCAAPASSCSTVPVEVDDAGGQVTNIVQISVGTSHACALLGDSTVWCWGDNGNGELGDPSVSGNSTYAIQVRNGTNTAPLTGVVQISAGEFDTCARMNDATARCWGAGTSGELGNGMIGDTSLPVVVLNSTGSAALTGITDIQTDYRHTCALLTDHIARCWGNNPYGELGDATLTTVSLPVVVKRSDGNALTGIAQLAVADGDFTCARLTSGGVSCWGANDFGQLGVGTLSGPQFCTGGKSCSKASVAVRNAAGSAPLTGVADLAAGAEHVCVALTDRSASCWGHDTAGQLGDNAVSSTPRVLPVPVLNSLGSSPLTNVIGVTAGVAQTCVRIADNTGRCWGSDASGQLGDGTETSSPLPVLVNDAPTPVIGPPNPPTHVTAVVGNHHAVVSWTSPNASNGAAITGVTVTTLPGGATQTLAAGTTTLDVTALTDGVTYTFTVHASNSAGDSPEAASNAIVPDDGLAPVVSVTAPVKPVALSVSVVVTWTGSDVAGIGHFEVRRASALYSGSLGAYVSWQLSTNATTATFVGTYGHTYCFEVRAADKAGHMSAWSAPECTVVPLRSDMLGYSAGWTKATSSLYFGGFAYGSKTHGATVTHKSIVAKRLYLIATSCATCGTAQVKFGGVVVANLNLQTSTTQRGRILGVAAYSTAHSGTVTITVTSASGKSVVVEGLAVSNGA